jgi:hypothetical protein
MDLTGRCFTAAGGAIYNDVDASLSITNSRFDFNCAGDGGGIFNKGTQPVTVSNSTFMDNTGEGIFNDLGATLIVNGNSKFDANNAGPQFPACICAGGGLFNKGVAMIDNVSFLDSNSATIGGGIFNVNNLTVTNSTFSANNASFGGGIANVPELLLSEGIEATLIVDGSTFSNNTACNNGDCGSATAGDGGGILNDGGNVVLKNSVTFSGNMAVRGGAIKNRGGTVTGTMPMYVSNSPDNLNNDPGNVELEGAILFAANGGVNCVGPITNRGYNISNDGSCGFGTSAGANGQRLGDNVDPRLDPRGLQNNGGPTQTIALLPGSPAVGAIPFAVCTDQSSPPMQITTDQRGYLRPVGKPCDIGPFQLNGIAPIINPLVDLARIDLGSFNSDLSAGQCPADNGFVGTFSFTAELTNKSGSTLTGLGVQVAKLTGGNFLQTGNATAGGKNAYQAVPVTLEPSTPPDVLSPISATMSPGARTLVTLVVCLKRVEPFRLSVDVLGTPSNGLIPRHPGRSFEFRLNPSQSCDDDAKRVATRDFRDRGCNNDNGHD